MLLRPRPARSIDPTLSRGETRVEHGAGARLELSLVPGALRARNQAISSYVRSAGGS